jgi:hypothetical protein
MRSVMIRARAAAVLLGLMVLMVLPRTWFHECAHAVISAHDVHEATVAADGHCPICDQVQPHYVAPATAPVLVRADVVRAFTATLPAHPLSAPVVAGSTRGPPTA